MEFWPLILELCEGFGFTLALFALTLLFSIPLGLLFAFGSLSQFKPIKWIVKALIWVERGTPLMLQIFVVSWIFPALFGIDNKEVKIFLNIETTEMMNFIFVLVAFALNYACYFAVIFEGGIKNVSQGQREAGQVLGMTKGQIFRNVVLMQVVRKISAPMSNEIITLVKDTSLARIIGVTEIMDVAFKNLHTYIEFSPLIYAGIFYLVFNGLLTIIFHLVEKKLSYYTV